jgi:3-deoxy-D-manno-octulosonic acid (KDO) 8-phosphate synthase
MRRIPFFLYFNTSLLIVVEECNRGMEKSIFLSKRKMRENSKKTRKTQKKKNLEERRIVWGFQNLGKTSLSPFFVKRKNVD